MKLKIDIESDNDALVSSNVYNELKNIFHSILMDVDGEHSTEGIIKDSNGNRVGTYEYENFRFMQQELRITVIYDPKDADMPTEWDWADLLDISHDHFEIDWASDPEPYTG